MTDPKCESRMHILTSINVYVPRDERFGHVKMSDFIAYGLKALAQVIKPGLQCKFDETPGEFDTFQDVLDMYEGGLPMPSGLIKDIRENVPPAMLKEIFRTDGERALRFPVPHIIKGIAYVSAFLSFFFSKLGLHIFLFVLIHMYTFSSNYDV